MSNPPLYNSFDENTSAKCVFCKQSIDDRLVYGDKYAVNGITFHNFCLVSVHTFRQFYVNQLKIKTGVCLTFFFFTNNRNESIFSVVFFGHAAKIRLK